MRVNLIANTSQFKSAMTESSNQIKLLNSEFKSAAAETDQYGNKLDATGAKKRQLSGVIEQYRHRITAIKNEQKVWNSELEKGNITEEQHAQKQQELARRLNNTEAEMKKYQGQLKRLNAEGQATRMTFEQFDQQFRDVGRTMRNVGSQVGITAGVGFMALKRVLGSVVNEAKDFYAQMSEVQAISGATADEMEVLTDQSKELGRETIFTSQQVAESQANLARAGFGVNEIYDSMEGLLDLAASSNLELARAAEITSGAIRTFNLEAEESGRVADILAKGAATANTDVQGLGQSIETAGPVANSLGVSIEGLAAATGVMADANIDGSKSGRMLRQGLLRLSKPTGEAGKLLEEMGVNAFDADGSMKSLDGVVAELEKGLKGYDKQQRAAALSTIFGSESTAGWTVLLDKGSDSLAEYTTELENSEGAAKEMADTMQDNADGAIIRMQSALSGLKIELGEKLLPILAKGADFIADLATNLAELDDETIQTVAEIALLTTGVLGVTTAVAGLVTGVGAFMALAGPVGVAIAGGTALLAGLAAVIYRNEQKTKNLKEEQEKAREEAIRYGEGISQGTREGVQGYIDLYEGAKLEMLKLKNMSGEEAEETKANVVKAFKDMGDEVVTELERFASDFDEVVKEIYGVYEDAGEQRAKEINEQVQKDVSEMVTSYEEASKRLAEIVDEFGGNVEEYPPEVRKTYEANLEIMRQGAEVFAVNYEDALAVRNRIAENKDKILAEEASKYVTEIQDVHSEASEAINDNYVEQAEIIEQFKVLYPEQAEVYDEMMQTLQTSTAEAYLEIDEIRNESLEQLYENVDTHGRLIDLQTGKEFERMEVEDGVLSHKEGIMKKRAETDEEYYLRYVQTSEAYLEALGDASDQSLDYIEQSAYDWRIAMGDSEEDAKKFASDIRQGVLDELDKGDEEAEKSGKDKGDAHKDGLKSTEEQNKKSGSDISKATDSGLGEQKGSSENHGKGKGDAHKYGLDSTKVSNLTSAELLSMGVSNSLGATTDGGGGAKAGNMFAGGISSKSGSARTAGTNVARSGESGLRAVNTNPAGTAFVSGFTAMINNGGGSVWTAAWNLGRKALGALKSSIDSHSPSKLTEEEGLNFTDGFSFAIDDGTKEAIKKSRNMGRATLDALSDEIDHYKHKFAEVALGIEKNKQTLRVEHALDSNFDNLSRAINHRNNEEVNNVKKLLDATLEQNKILMKLLQKDNNTYLDGDLISNNVDKRMTNNFELDYYMRGQR